MLSDLLWRSRKIVAAVNLHASLMVRLDRLGPAGREYSHALLAAVARKSDAQLALALDRLADGCAN
jgi:hypothetical protein